MDELEEICIKEFCDKLLKYLIESNPYPEDIFIKVGKEARVGYNSCIFNISKFLEEYLEE